MQELPKQEPSVADILTPDIDGLDAFKADVRSFVRAAAADTVEVESSISIGFESDNTIPGQTALERLDITDNGDKVRLIMFAADETGSIGSVTLPKDGTPPEFNHRNLDAMLAVLSNEDLLSLAESDDEESRQIGEIIVNCKTAFDVIQEARPYGLVHDTYNGPSTEGDMSEEQFNAVMKGMPSTTMDGLFVSGSDSLRRVAEIASGILASNPNAMRFESGWLTKDLSDGSKLTARYKDMSTGNNDAFDEFARLGLLDTVINFHNGDTTIDITVPVDEGSEVEIFIADNAERREAVANRLKINPAQPKEEYHDADQVMSLSVSGTPDFMTELAVYTEARRNSSSPTVEKITVASSLISDLRGKLNV